MYWRLIISQTSRAIDVVGPIKATGLPLLLRAPLQVVASALRQQSDLYTLRSTFHPAVNVNEARVGNLRIGIDEYDLSSKGKVLILGTESMRPASRCAWRAIRLLTRIIATVTASVARRRATSANGVTRSWRKVIQLTTPNGEGMLPELRNRSNLEVPYPEPPSQNATSPQQAPSERRHIAAPKDRPPIKHRWWIPCVLRIQGDVHRHIAVRLRCAGGKDEVTVRRGIGSASGIHTLSHVRVVESVDARYPAIQRIMPALQCTE